VYSNPSDKKSIQNRVDIGIADGTQSVRFQINWIKSVTSVLQGMALTTGKLQYNMVKQMCKGQVWTAFHDSVGGQQLKARADEAEEAADELEQEDDETNQAFEARKQQAYDARIQQAVPAVSTDMVATALKATMTVVCPYKALEMQKRFMRRKMRKPADMKTRAYVNHLVRINMDELPMLPPFDNNQSLSSDEIMDIVLFGIPKSWQSEMTRQGFDPFRKTLNALVDFCERMESAENFTPNNPSKKAGSASSSKKAKIHKAQGKTSKGDTWCEFHESSSHNTSDCTVLQKLKASRKNSDKKPAAKKDWKGKADDAKKFTKKELNAIVKKKVQQAKKELNAVAKRKKGDDDDESVSSLNMLEAQMREVDDELAKFNFDDAKLGKSADC
jgi:hypothetical protein